MRFMLLRKQFCSSTDVYCDWKESKSFKLFDSYDHLSTAQCLLDQPKNEEVQGIVEIEEPLHDTVDRRVLTSLAVVQEEQGDRKYRA